jgi:hypothetical protein
MEPYLGSFPAQVSPSARGGTRTFSRPQGAKLVNVQHAIVEQTSYAEQRLPGLLSEISEIAAAADPLALYAQLQVVTGMRRASLPGSAGFGMDAVLEFYGGLVTAMPEPDVLDRLGIKPSRPDPPSAATASVPAVSPPASRSAPD